MTKWLYTIILCFSVVSLFTASGSALSYPQKTVGQDISWPNCNNLNFNASSFGIVGVNGGLSFRANPCLGSEATLYRQNLSLYLNTGFPGSPYDLKYQSSPLNCAVTDNNCLAYNYGYNAGKYATNYALSRGVVSNNWWLDVETVNSWSTSPSNNTYSLIGEATAINESLKPNLIGYYSTPYQWQVLTAGWQNNAPIWYATNSNHKTDAEKQCSGINFNGGKIKLTQYISSLDLDLAC
jgi:hypothetical protein